YAGKIADARSDVWAFSVSLYEALYGVRPFPDHTYEVLMASVCLGEVREPPRGTRVPAVIQRAVARGLRPEPAERHQTLEPLLEALAFDPDRGRRRVVLAAGVLVLAVAGVG